MSAPAAARAAPRLRPVEIALAGSHRELLTGVRAPPDQRSFVTLNLLGGDILMQAGYVLVHENDGSA